MLMFYALSLRPKLAIMRKGICMKTKKLLFKRLLPLITVFVLLIPGIYAQNTENMPFQLSSLPGFTPLEIFYQGGLYTPVYLPGVDGIVYAFTGEGGITQFRVYGAVAGKTGFYPLNVIAGEDYQDGMSLSLSLSSDTPVIKDENLAIKAVIPKDNIIIPQGFTKANTHGLMYFENLFGNKEYRAYASYDGGKTFLYLPTENSRPKLGALGRLPDDMLSRAKIYGEKNYKLPANLASGFGELVNIKTTDGIDITIPTIYPFIERAALVQPMPTIAPYYPPGYTYVVPGKTVAERNHELNSKNDIINIQNRLTALGYNCGKVDGIVGDRTIAAIRAFQRDNKLSQDGIAGPKTKAKLFSKPDDTPPPVKPTDTVKPQPTDTPTPTDNRLGLPYYAKARTTGGKLNIWFSPEVIGRGKKNIAYSVNNGDIIGMVQDYIDGYSELLDGNGFVRTRYLIKIADNPPKK